MKKFLMHCHTDGRSPCGQNKPDELIRVAKEHGYRGVVVTDHFMEHLFNEYYTEATHEEKLERFLAGYRSVRAEGEKEGITVLLGMELNPSEYNRPDLVGYPVVELLTYGLTEEFLYRHPHIYSYPHSEIFRLANENGFLLIQSHPFRTPTHLGDTRYLHGIEVYNAHPYVDSHNELAQAEAKEHPDWVLTAGDDFHRYDMCGNAGLYLPDWVDSNEALVRALKAKDYELFIKAR